MLGCFGVAPGGAGQTIPPSPPPNTQRQRMNYKGFDGASPCYSLCGGALFFWETAPSKAAARSQGGIEISFDVRKFTVSLQRSCIGWPGARTRRTSSPPGTPCPLDQALPARHDRMIAAPAGLWLDPGRRAYAARPEVRGYEVGNVLTSHHVFSNSPSPSHGRSASCLTNRWLTEPRWNLAICHMSNSRYVGRSAPCP